MTTRKQTAAAAAPAEVQQPEKLPYYLEILRPIFELLEKFVEGDKSVQEKLRSDVATARQNKDHKGNIDAALGKLVVIGNLPISLFSDVLDQKSAGWLTRRADEFMRCAQEVGTQIQTWSREEARRVLNLFRAKQGTAKPSKVMAILATRSSAFPALESWAYPKARATKEQTAPALLAVKQKLELEQRLAALEVQESEAATAKDYAKAGEIAGQIVTLRQEIANLTATAATPVEAVDEHEEEVDETPSIEEQIAELAAQESVAVAAKDYARAGEIATQIAALRQEVEVATVVVAGLLAEPFPVVVEAPVAAPVVATATATAAAADSGSSEFTVDDASDLCGSENATPDMKRLVARRQGQGKPLSDAEFIRKAQNLGKLAKLL